jgi:hypothetical protein
VDALSAISALAARADRIAPGPPGPAPASLVGGSGGFAAGRTAIRGRDVLPALERLGIRFELRHGRLVDASSGSRSALVEALVTRAGRLLVGYLSDHPVMCELDGHNVAPEAVTLTLSGLGMCQAHASGELRP